MELERAVARLAEACLDLERAAVRQAAFHKRRAERMRNENGSLQRTNVQIAHGLEEAIVRLRKVLGE